MLIIAVALTCGLALFVLFKAPKAKENPRTYADAKATANEQSPECLGNNTGLELSGADQTGLENALVTQLTDVPAGTTTEINVATYANNKATGSETYGGDYGHYNFEAEKEASGSWKVVSFVSCKHEL